MITALIVTAALLAIFIGGGIWAAYKLGKMLSDGGM